jgi:MFS transporter, ACS family, hexuronate transporter
LSLSFPKISVDFALKVVWKELFLEKTTLATPVLGPADTKRIGISRHGKGIIAFLFILSAISFTDKSITGYLSVPIINEFHLSSTQWGIISGSFFWLFSLSSLLVGAWSDKVGTTRVLSLVAVAWTIVQAATIFVASFPLLLLTRVGLGIGEGPYAGVAMTAAAKWLPRERRGLGFAIIACGNLAGPAILTPFLILFASSHGWRSAFLILGVCSLLWLVGWTFVSREGPQSEDLVGEDEMAASCQKSSWKDLLSLMLSRNVILITLATFGAYWMQGLFLSWLAVYLINVRHLQLDVIAAVSVLSVLLTCLVQISLSMLADRWFRRTGKLRAYVYVLSFVLLITAIVNYSAVLVGPVALSVLLLCIQPNGTAFPIAGTLIANITSSERRGAAQGASIAVATIGGILGPTLTGPLLQSAGKNLAQGFQTVYLISAILLVTIALAAFLFIRPE